MFLISICDFDSLFWLLLWWLLPFLLGLLLGYLIWAGWKSKFEKCNHDLGDARMRIAELEKLLEECKSEKSRMNNDLVLFKAQIKELEATIESGHDTSSSAVGLSSQSAASSDDTGIYTALKDNNLQVIEGIGPKMESVLKSKGIDNLSALAKCSVDDIQKILDSYGGKYRIIDPVTWPEQAKLAASGKWEDLITRQKALSGGTLQTSHTTDSKVEKILIKKGLIKQWKQDDLKAIEGIGPKIAELLGNRGITTWEGLAGTSVNTLKEILLDAGDSFRLADPMTWPDQAKLAAEGRWKELEKFQDLLKGGRKA